MQLRGDGLVDDQGERQGDDDRILYVVHPNCVVDDV